ncbi:hypothetical protein [Caulobacter hibisci]|uniref:Uncharacterized protein n=1 Tax=Caulobacter hibisci TaxID=2035993 RepID=A0ABS0SY62_9CAUL|nr:hypothetical protein [Caulobacter hibisci]MBI1684489.1 hypothetical protein [Caulobacter hibisci]
MRALLLALGVAMLAPSHASAADVYLTDSGKGRIRVIDVEAIVGDGDRARLGEVRGFSAAGTTTEKVRFDCRAGFYEIVWRLAGPASEQTTTSGFPARRPKAGSPQALEMKIACQGLRPADRRLGDTSVQDLIARAALTN